LCYLVACSFAARQVPWVLVLIGSTASIDSTHLQATGKAYSEIFTTMISNQFGVETHVRNLVGPTAFFNSIITLSSPINATTFTEAGNITFGASHLSQIHALTFQTVGMGTLNNTYQAGFTGGAVIWEITGGVGAFQGAEGLITSNFVANGNTDDYIDYEVGNIWLP